MKLPDLDRDGSLAFDQRVARELGTEVDQRMAAVEQQRPRRVRKVLNRRRQTARRTVG
jgi:hypothetical protein